MRKCEDCKIILDDSAQFCPKCGQTVGGVSAGPKPTGDVDQLLTSANLHRMRGQLDAAASEASQAMQQDPNNPAAAALLATIFDERGDLAESAVWFKIAVDLDPNNAVYKAQLDRVGKALARKHGSRRTSRKPVAPVIWAVIVGVVALVLASIVLFGRGDARKPVVQQAAQPQERVRVATAEQGIKRGATTSQQSGSQSRTGSSQTISPAPVGSRTAAESAIKTTASRANGVVQARATIDDVIVDPRQRLATVTFTIPGTGIINKDRILTAAAPVVRAVFAANLQLQYVTARCLVASTGGGGSQIAFVSDTGRPAFQNLSEKPTADQISGVFGNQWWNPQIK